MELVSIITASFNDISYVGETYKSIQNQTYQNWEWMVTDDCSTDGTYEYLLELAILDPRIKIYQNTFNEGAAVSRNNSIQNANGRFLAFLDSDDLWGSEKLDSQVKFMLKKDVAFSYSDYSFVNEKGGKINRIRKTPNVLNYKLLLRENKIGCLTAIYDSSKIGKVFMPLMRKRQDFGLWLNILKLVPEAHRCPGVLAMYRIRDNSVSSNKTMLLRYNLELFYKHQNMSATRSLYYVLMNIVYKLKSA